MRASDPIGRISASTFFHLKAGERQSIKIASEDQRTAERVALIVREFLQIVSSSNDPDLERAFVVGREMASVWPERFRRDIESSILHGVSGPVAKAFTSGFLQESTVINGQSPKPPTLYRLNQVIRRITVEGVPASAYAAQRLIADHLAYTEATGFSEFLRNATVRLAVVLLKRPQPEQFEAGTLVQAFVRTVLRWEPWNARLWHIWSDSYLAQGGLDPAELILWESARRFPNDAPVFDKLIRLLSRQSGRVLEAAHLADASLNRFPANSHIENAASTAMRRAGQFRRAIEISVASLRRHRLNDPNITALAASVVGLAGSGLGEFETVLELLSALPVDGLLLGKIGRSLAQQKLRNDHLVMYYRFTVSRLGDDLWLRNRLAATLAQSKHEDFIKEARILFENVLDDDPDNSFAREGIDRLDRGELEIPDTNLSDVVLSSGDSGTVDLLGEEVRLGTSALKLTLWPGLPSSVTRLGRARRLKSRLEAANDNIRSEALQELREALRTDPTFAFAQILAVQQGLWQSESMIAPTFAAAFEMALQERDLTALRTLGDSDARMRALTLGALATFGDSEARAKIIQLTADDQARTDLESRVISALAPVLQVVSGQSTSRLAAEATFVRLREINEWASEEALDLAA